MCLLKICSVTAVSTMSSYGDPEAISFLKHLQKNQLKQLEECHHFLVFVGKQVVPVRCDRNRVVFPVTAVLLF